MNIKTILNILSALLTILGLTMLFPAFVSWLYDESDVIFCLQSAGLAVFIGLPIWFMSRKSRKLRNRDGFIIVTFSGSLQRLLVHYHFIYPVLYQILRMHFLKQCLE